MVFIIIAYIPPTMWRQYFAVPVPFILTGLVFPLAYLRNQSLGTKARKYYTVGKVSIIICVLVNIVTYPIVIYRTPLVLLPDVWAPVELHKLSKDIAGKTPEPKLALTLAPLYAIEGSCEIYTELSCGAIIYRIADSLTPEERRITHTVGPETLPELVERKPPSAVIVGVEMEPLEKTIFDAAVKLNWRIKEYENGLTVYFRP
jgi:hypothetical protein